MSGGGGCAEAVSRTSPLEESAVTSSSEWRSVGTCREERRGGEEGGGGGARGAAAGGGDDLCTDTVGRLALATTTQEEEAALLTSEVSEAFRVRRPRRWPPPPPAARRLRRKLRRMKEAELEKERVELGLQFLLSRSMSCCSCSWGEGPRTDFGGGFGSATKGNMAIQISIPSLSHKSIDLATPLLYAVCTVH